MQGMKAEPRKNAPKPISLAPLTFDEALSALLKVKPPPKPERKKAEPKKASKKR